MIGKLINLAEKFKDKLWYTDLKPIAVTFDVALKKAKKENWTIYDTRVYLDFNKFAIENAKHVSRFTIKFQIFKHDVKDKIILIADKNHVNAFVVRWARHHGYKNIYCSSYCK